MWTDILLQGGLYFYQKVPNVLQNIHLYPLSHVVTVYVGLFHAGRCLIDGYMGRGIQINPL